MSECIAIPLAEGCVSAHFGHATCFAFVTIDGDDLHIENRTPPAHAPGVLPQWLAAEGAQVVIAGGMGPQAVNLLAASGIRCLLGVPALDITEAIAHYRDHRLPTGQVSCTHDTDAACPGH